MKRLQLIPQKYKGSRDHYEKLYAKELDYQEEMNS